MSDNSLPQSDPVIESFATIAKSVGAFVVLYDPYYPDQARQQIAQADAVRSVDAPNARIIVILPNMRQHVESGNHIDLDLLRQNVDSVCVFDNESARRIQRALSGSKARVVTFPSPRLREVQNFSELPDDRQLPSVTAMVQALFDVTPQQARQLARQYISQARG